MITNVWLKTKPKDKLTYPNAYPEFNLRTAGPLGSPGKGVILGVYIVDADRAHNVASYSVEIISRIEFKP